MKQYRPTLLYFIKIFGLIILALFSVFIISLFFDIIAYFVQSSLFEKLLFAILILVCIGVSFMIIRSNNPSIRLGQDTMIIGQEEISYHRIENFYPSKGGSEPYILTKDGRRIDLEISWFRKKDRVTIEQVILERINSDTKQDQDVI
ncbi:hypothetical protein [Aquimarina sp. 2201CG14-23]|uniref:hypothetical protein n=1 Tax=Aquimarina mycalae TaxID=3040073 RepID=UPI002477FA5B|nr:hypothetical protein [Aquimarina sp. 2201CG14-23]MDH7447536.1 hypothetical protein [Aquimarina sp. 2201CG14-23]